MKLFQSIMMISILSVQRSVVSFVPATVVKAITANSSSSSVSSNHQHISVRHLFNQLFGGSNSNSNDGTTTTNMKKYPILGDESIMSKKEHGTSHQPVQQNLRWNCDYDTADRIWYVC